MANAQLGTVVHHIRRMTVTACAEPTSDAELLERFVNRREESAFETLVQRHGPLVLSLCRRLLDDRHEAEDAFQCTFLVLARNAGAVRKRDSLGSWLYGVAYRVSRQLRLRNAQRQRQELRKWQMEDLRMRHGPMQTEPSDVLADKETRAQLDVELARLPKKYREPVVLCYLEGQSNSAAALQLGLRIGTVKSRLTHARRLLRRRLERRGTALSVATVTMLLSTGTAKAKLPVALVTTTTKAAVAFLAGQTVGRVQAEVVMIAAEMAKSMAGGKVRLTLALVLAVSLCLGYRQAAGHQSGEAKAPAPGSETRDLSRTPAVDTQGDRLPPGALARLGTARLRHGGLLTHVRFVDGGKSLLTVGRDQTARLWDVCSGQQLRSTRFALDDFPNKATSVRSTAVAGGGVVFIADDDPGRTALSADGKVLAMAAANGMIGAWETSTGKKLMQGGDAGSRIMDLALSPDGRHLAGRSFHQGVWLFDVGSSRRPRSIVEEDNAPGVIWDEGGMGGGLVFSPDGTRLVVSGIVKENEKPFRAIQVFSVETGKEICRIAEPADVEFTATPRFSPDGKYLAWARLHGSIQLAEASTGKRVHSFGNDKQANCGNYFAFSPDGKTLVSFYQNEPGLLVWDVATGKRLRMVASIGKDSLWSPTGAETMAISPDGRLLACGSEKNSVRVFDLTTGMPLPYGVGHQWGIERVTLDGSGKTLQTWGRTIGVWDAATGKEIRQVELPTGSWWPIISSHGRLLAHGFNDTIVIRDAVTQTELRHFNGPKDGLNSLAFSPDGKTLAAHGTADRTAGIWLYDPATGKELLRIAIDLPIPDQASGAFLVPAYPLSGILFTPDGKRVATRIGAHEIGLWNVATGSEVIRIQAPDKKPIRGAVFTPDGHSLVLDLGNDVVSIHEVLTGRQRQSFAPRLADSKRDLDGSNAFRAADDGPLQFMTRLSPRLAISPKGRLIALGCSDGSVHVYDRVAAKEMACLQGHQGMVEALAFYPDGSKLVSGSSDTTALIWDMTHHASLTVAPATDMATAWDALKSDDAVHAFDAARALAVSEQTVPYFKQRLHPMPGVDAARTAKLIVDLENSKFAVRQQAGEALESLGDAAIPHLEAALKGKPSLEARRRLEDVIATATKNSSRGENLRCLRAIEVLEMIGTRDASAILRTLSQGDPGAVVTQAARASLQRVISQGT
jgi:RNA polymerase sigma factor (sigma-70 family)